MFINNSIDPNQEPISRFVDIKCGHKSFKMLTINSDDTTVHRVFYGLPTPPSLAKWNEWCQKKGIYIDVGAHTGMYSLATLHANYENELVTIEPLTVNFYRIISNIRLNDPRLFKRTLLLNKAVTNKNKMVYFSNLNADFSYNAKGGKISDKGQEIHAIKLDNLEIKNQKKIEAIKIDTEGEDYLVLLGAKKIIYEHSPKIVIETRKNNIADIISFLKENMYDKIYTINQQGDVNFDLNLNIKETAVLDIFAEKLN